MAFEKNTERASQPDASSHVWAQEAAAAYHPQMAGLSRVKSCNPSLPPITHDQFLHEFGLGNGREPGMILEPPKGWDPNKPNGNYHDSGEPDSTKPHPITQPCVGEPVVSQIKSKTPTA